MKKIILTVILTIGGLYYSGMLHPNLSNTLNKAMSQVSQIRDIVLQNAPEEGVDTSELNQLLEQAKSAIEHGSALKQTP